MPRVHHWNIQGFCKWIKERFSKSIHTQTWIWKKRLHISDSVRHNALTGFSDVTVRERVGVGPTGIKGTYLFFFLREMNQNVKSYVLFCHHLKASTFNKNCTPLNLFAHQDSWILEKIILLEKFQPPQNITLVCIFFFT